MEWEDPSWKERAVKAWERAQRLQPETFLQEASQLLKGDLLAMVLVLTKHPQAPRIWQRYQPGDKLPDLRMRIEAQAARASVPGRRPLRDALLAASTLGPATDLIPLFEAARRAAPRDPVVALERARFLVGREYFGEARVAIREARELGTDARELAFLEADILWMSGKRHLAVPRLEALYEEKSDDRVGRMSRARVWIAHQDDERAYAAAQDAVRAHPDDPESYWLLSQVVFSKSQGKRAHEARDLMFESFARGGGLHVHTLSGYLTIAGILILVDADGKPRKVKGRDIEQIISGYERGLPLSRGPLLHINGASFLLQLPKKDGRLEQALAWAQRARTIDDRRGDVYLVEGTILLRKGAPREQILDLWKQGLAIEPRLQFPDSILDAFKQKHGAAGLEQFEGRRRED